MQITELQHKHNSNVSHLKIWYWFSFGDTAYNMYALLKSNKLRLRWKIQLIFVHKDTIIQLLAQNEREWQVQTTHTYTQRFVGVGSAICGEEFIVI